MLWYILKLLVLLPLIGALAWGSLKLAQKMQARMSKQKTTLATEKSDLADRQEKLRQQLSTRFAGVDTRVSASKSTLPFLQSQIAAWNSSKN